MTQELVLLLLTIVIIPVVLPTVNGHVALTFPRARKYGLDFLDSARTPGPCGMPQGDVKTHLLAGSKFNITWHLAYPHNGGFKLQILDALDRPLIDLTPVTQQSEFVEGDATAQSYPVELPQNFTCTDCTVRLLREAEEWGSNYRFWSCADIDILDRKMYREDCSGHGRYLLGRCRCDRLYHGQRCEFKEDCLDDSDCGNQGVCVDNYGSTAPTKHCYCNVGWYGPGCTKKSIAKSSEIDFDGYTMKRFSDDFIFYWRIIKDTNELEGVMVANTTSWIAIGWRPNNLTPTCRAFPEIHDEFTPEVLSHPEPNSDTTLNKITFRQSIDRIINGPQLDDTAQLLSHAFSKSTAEPSKSSARRRSAKQIYAQLAVTPRSDGDVTVQTSVTYKVSTKHGRKRRSSESITTQPIGDPTSSVPDPAYQLVPLSEFTSQPLLETSSKKTNASESTSHPISKSESTSHPISISESTSESVFKIASLPSELKIGMEQTSERILESELSSIDSSHSVPTTEPKTELMSVSHAVVAPLPESKSQSVLESESNFHADPSSEPIFNSNPFAESKSNFIPMLSDSVSNRNSTFKSSLLLINKDAEHSIKAGATKAPLRPTVHRYTPNHDFNPMDCTDMVVGMARNNTHRIGDYYTRDRSTPQLDVFWGGKDSLTAATGFEKDGVTTIVFRKPLTTNEPTDYNIADSNMQVIWAKGQEAGAYNHQPPVGLEKNKASIQNFYKPDELKYHGQRSQRGVVILNFYDEKNTEEFGGHAPLDGKHCGGEWKYPRSCSVKNVSCEYYIKWIYKTKSDQMTFTIMTKNSDVWTGVGFSDNEKMTQTDAVLGWVDNTNGRPFVMDTWISGYNAPLLDLSQDIYNTSGKIENGITFLTFSRKRGAKDNKDLSFTDDHCLYMIFPVKGGIFNSVNKKIRKHAGIPVISTERICIKSCGIEQGEDEEISTRSSSKFYYDVQVKLVNLGDGFIAPPPGSHDFDIISNRISDNFGPILSNVPGYYAITLNELRGNREEGIIASMNLIVDRNENEGKALKAHDTLPIIEGALKQTLVTGKVGSLTVDPQYLIVMPLRTNEMSNDILNIDESFGLNVIQLSATKLYVIMGCVVALIALALLQVCCTLFKTTRKKTTKQERLIANNGWKDYSNGAKTNFGFEGFETKEKAAPPPVSSLSRLRDSPDSAMMRTGEMVNPIERHILTNQQQISAISARATYSLPRAPGPRQQSPPPQLDYYTQDRRNNRTRGHNNSNSQISAQQPDFYFMPSQRKYSGEVVRVYVDYENQKPK